MKTSIRKFIHDKLYLKDGTYTLVKGTTQKTIVVTDCIQSGAYTPDTPFTAKQPPTGLSDFTHYACGCKRGLEVTCPKH